MTNEVTIKSEQFLSVPYSYELAAESLRNAVANHNKTGIEIGLWVIALKENEDHGNYERALKSCGMSSSGAHRYAQRATHILTHEKEYGAINLRDLNGSKLDKLLKLPERTTAELYDEDGNIAGISPDEIASMTAKQFEMVLSEKAQMIEGVEDEVHHLEGRLAKSDMEKTKLLKKIETLEADKQRLSAHPEIVEHCAIMSTHWTNVGIDCLNRFEPLIQTLAGETVLEPAEKAIAASAIAYNLRYLHAKTGELLGDIVSQCKDSIKEEIGEWQHLPDEMILRIENMRNDMLMRHDAQEAIKKNEVADKVGKRGRRNKVA